MTTSYLVVDSKLGAEDQAFFEKLHECLGHISIDGPDLKLVDRLENASQISLVYENESTTLRVVIWDDYIGETRYLEITTKDDHLHRLAINKFMEELPILENADILERAKFTIELEPKILYQVAYSAPPQYEANNFDLIMDALSSNNSKLREAATEAIGILGWPQFKPVLEESYYSEEPGQTKLMMERALSMFGH